MTKHQALRLVAFLLPPLGGLLTMFRRGALFRGTANFLKDWRKWKELPQDPLFPGAREPLPCIYDRYEEAGSVPRHYFHQDLWAARKVRASGVKRHWDCGSRLDGFVAHCLSFTEVEFLDLRPLDLNVEGLSFRVADLDKALPVPAGGVSSLSCLHVLEHIGLGRYGDRLEPLSYRRAIRNLIAAVQDQGSLYVSVPVGRPRIEFNAHRVFRASDFRDLFEGCELREFALIDDENRLQEGVPLTQADGLEYGCGLFHFIRKTPSSERP